MKGLYRVGRRGGRGVSGGGVSGGAVQGGSQRSEGWG